MAGARLRTGGGPELANILVTGGTGLIGSSITDHLARAGHKVVTYDLVSVPENVDQAAGDLTLLTGDICDAAALSATMAQHRIDHVVQMAAVLSEGADRNPALTMAVNVGGVANVLEAARKHGVRRVIWASSAAALGAGAGYDGRPVSEDHEVRPETLYGCSKLGAEIVARKARREGLDCIALRPGLVYGLGRLTGGAGAFNAAVQNVALGRPAVIPEMAGFLFQPMYNRDFGRLMEHMLFATTEGLLPAYNMPAAEKVSGQDIAAALLRLVPDAQVEVQSLPPYLPVPPLMDGSRAERDFGFAPKYTIETAFAEMIAAFRQRG